LFATITIFEKLGLSKLLAHVSHSTWEIVISSTISANIFNNLPAYLAFESVQKTTDIYFVLIGTNFGSIVLPWGSLATLLWAQRCRSSGVEVSWPHVIAFSAICALVIVPVSSLLL
jgi:arsenical pump membrane protein